MTATDWNHVKNLLCIRLDAMGDVLMTTPAIRALKQPGREITLLTSSAGSGIAALIPEVDRVLTYDPPWMKATVPQLNSQPELEMIERLRSHQFDAAIIFTVFSQNPLPATMLCYLADIPLRLAHCHENPYQLLTHWVLDLEPSYGIRHEVRRQLDLVGGIGSQVEDERLSLQIPDRYLRSIFSRLNSLQVNLNQPWVVIHPGASAISRRYPPEKFAEVARRLVLDNHYQIIFTGSELEQALVEIIRSTMGADSHSLAGCLELAELGALIAIAPLLIANNTGPIHIAAAVGTPVVDLYALTNPQHTPWQIPHRVLFHDVPCKFCYKSICPEGHHHCLQLVTPDEIVEAVHELIESPLNKSLNTPLASDRSFNTSSSKDSFSTILQSAREVWR
jgi:lipopolysaccharide heptosyltransferase II